MRISTTYFTDLTVKQINQKQSSLAVLQEQIASGQRISKPSDDPATVARAQTIDSTRQRLEQFQKNAVMAEQRISLEEDTMDRVTDVIQRVQELALAAKSGTITQEKLSAYGSEVQQHLYELVDYANSQNANGEYIFAGRMGKTQPFIMSNNNVTYQGDQGSVQIQVGASRTVAVSDSGDRLFEMIPTGNGTFKVGAANTNTGTGVLGTGSVSNNLVYQPDNFTIRFQTADTYEVVNETTGATILTAQPFSEGSNFTFNGMTMRITGTPSAGDEFTVEPSATEDLFSTLAKFVSATENNPANQNERALLDQTLNSVLDSLDQAHIHVNTMRSEIGSRLRFVDSANDENSSVDFLLESTLSDMLDTDYAKAASELTMQQTTLEAVRQTYAKISSNSLFDYL